MFRDFKEFWEDFKGAKSIWLKMFILLFIAFIILIYLIWDVHLAEPFKQRVSKIDIPYIKEIKETIRGESKQRPKKNTVKKGAVLTGSSTVQPQLLPAKKKKTYGIQYGDMKTISVIKPLKLIDGSKELIVYYKYKFDDYDDSITRTLIFSNRGITKPSLFGNDTMFSSKQKIREGNSLPFCLNKKMYQLDVLSFNDSGGKSASLVINKLIKSDEYKCL